MIPHKTNRGQAALERLKAFEGIPPPYDLMKRAVVPDALKCVRLVCNGTRSIMALATHVRRLFSVWTGCCACSLSTSAASWATSLHVWAGSTKPRWRSWRLSARSSPTRSTSKRRKTSPLARRSQLRCDDIPTQHNRLTSRVSHASRVALQTVVALKTDTSRPERLAPLRRATHRSPCVLLCPSLNSSYCGAPLLAGGDRGCGSGTLVEAAEVALKRCVAPTSLTREWCSSDSSCRHTCSLQTCQRCRRRC